MKAEIYCKPADKGIHSFYLVLGAEEFFLFSQAYRKGVDDYYRGGVFLNDAINYSKAHKDCAITRTMSKIPTYVRYIEKEYDVKVLEKTKRSNQDYRLRCA